MENILKHLDLETHSADCLFYCLDCYNRGEYEDGMKYQFEYLRSVYDLECSSDGLDEEDKQLMYDMIDWIQGYRIISNTDIPMYMNGNEENEQEKVIVE